MAREQRRFRTDGRVTLDRFRQLRNHGRIDQRHGYVRYGHGFRVSHRDDFRISHRDDTRADGHERVAGALRAR
jgi:hypothetical protein